MDRKKREGRLWLADTSSYDTYESLTVPFAEKK